MKDKKGHFLLGNHDIEIIGKMDDEYLSFVIDNMEHRYDFNLRGDNKDWLRKKTKKSLKAELQGRFLFFVHSYLKEGYFQYLDNNKIIQEFLETFNRHNSIIFVGHTHVPGLYSLSKEGILTKNKVVYGEWLPLGGERKHLVNVGSTGEPRDGRKNGTYALLDTENLAVMFREVNAVL
jgi:diadenosine tetraphosphatase ApaH/serine/threonine PP2A family protein phosphatase